MSSRSSGATAGTRECTTSGDASGRKTIGGKVTAVYVFGGIMAALILAVVFAPLVEDRMRGGSGGPESPTERKEAAVEALRELEFEYQTGKVSEEDYARLRARYAREALTARDELGSATGAAFCPGCGEELRAGVKFCSRCGAAIA